MLSTIDIWAEFCEVIRTKRMMDGDGGHIVPSFTPHIDKFVLFDVTEISKTYDRHEAGREFHPDLPFPETAIVFGNESSVELGLLNVSKDKLYSWAFRYIRRRTEFRLYAECEDRRPGFFGGHSWIDPDVANRQINIFLTWATLIANRDVEYVYDVGGTATKRINTRREKLNLPTIPPIKRIIHLTELKIIRPVEGIGAGSETHGTRGPYDFVKAEWQVVRTTRSGRTVEYTARRKPELLDRKKTKTYFEVRP